MKFAEVLSCNHSPSGNLASWSGKWELNGTDEMRISYSEVCEHQNTNIDFLFNAMEGQKFVGYCNALKGNIVIPTGTSELVALYDTLINKYPGIISESMYFWTDLSPIGETGNWSHSNSKEPVPVLWARSQPDGNGQQLCAFTMYDGIHDVPCKNNEVRGICKIPSWRRLTLRGLPLDTDEDIEFKIVQTMLITLYLKDTKTII